MNRSALGFGSYSTASPTQEEELSVKCDLEKEKKAKVRAFSAHSTFMLSHRTQMWPHSQASRYPAAAFSPYPPTTCTRRMVCPFKEKEKSTWLSQHAFTSSLLQEISCCGGYAAAYNKLIVCALSCHTDRALMGAKCTHPSDSFLICGLRIMCLMLHNNIFFLRPLLIWITLAVSLFLFLLILLYLSLFQGFFPISVSFVFDHF